MIITCSSCSARYQLADAKVKPKGTKVRCPRCSHKFTVFPEKKEENPAASTELFVRKQGVINDDRTLPPESVRPTQDSDFETTPVRKKPVEDDPFDQPTRAYDPGDLLGKTSDREEDSNSTADHNEMSEAEKAIDQAKGEDFSEPQVADSETSKPPMEDPAKVQEPEKPRPEAADGDLDDSGEVRPFGDQTLFEIQKEGKKSKPRLLRYVAGFFVFAALGAGAYYLSQTISFDSAKIMEARVEKIEINRPQNWYRDEPQTYQDILASVAGYPKKERAKALNRALLSETLVLHGLLTDQNSEVIQGLGYAGSALNKEGVNLGVFANSAWAIWENKLEIQVQLLESWPDQLKQTPEYGLLKFMTLARTKQLPEAFSEVQTLVKKFPDFQRANDYGFYLSLRFRSEAKKHLPAPFRSKLEASYERHLSRLNKQLSKLPDFYSQIEQLRGSSKSVGGSKKKESAPTRAEPKEPQKEELADEQPPFKRKAPVPNPFEIGRSGNSGARSNGKSKTGLPFASSDLIAKNSRVQTDRKAASNFLKEGNQKAQAGDDKAALLAYREAIKRDSSLAEVYKRIGMLYMRQQESQKARTAFQLYLRLSPNTSDKQVVEGWISSLE